MSGELYNNLLTAEKAINEIWPLAMAQWTAKRSKQASEAAYATHRSNYMPGVWMLRICIPAAVLCLLLSFVLPSGAFFGPADFARVGCFLFAVFILAGITLVLMYGKKCRQAKAEIAAHQREFESATAQLEDAKSRRIRELALAIKLMPKDCFEPCHARVFVGYFETGRASTLPEALKLFEEYIHRYRMEQMAKEQLAQADAIKAEIQRIGNLASYPYQ